MHHITIIGAGAAGLMAAATILESKDIQGDYHIHLFEKNTTPGKKILLSGGGRCNVTTALDDKKILSTKYTRGWDFIKKTFGKFSPKKCREWFESHGVPLKVEDNFRIFPCSDDGRDIVGVFEDIIAKNRHNISIHYGEGVTEVSKEGNAEKYIIKTEKGIYHSDILIITTGGNAYSHTGSTGDGYAFARSLGHTVTRLGPSLSSFLTSETWFHELSGLVLEDASIIIGGDTPPLAGSLLLTHFGISGPLTFMTSSHLAWDDIGKGQQKVIHLRPRSSMGEQEWEIFLRETFANHPKRLLISILTEHLPRRFAEGFVEQYFPHLRETFAGSISRKDRESITNLLGHGVPITLLDRRPGDEFVTAGGVSTDEIDPETMESKIQKNLYFAGEILNVDGYTGGFSLQICWASGYVVGKSVEKIEK